MKRSFYPVLLQITLPSLSLRSLNIHRTSALSAIANARSTISTEQRIDDGDIGDVGRALCEDTTGGWIVFELEVTEVDISLVAEKVGPVAGGKVLEMSMFEGG